MTGMARGKTRRHVVAKLTPVGRLPPKEAYRVWRRMCPLQVAPRFPSALDTTAGAGYLVYSGDDPAEVGRWLFAGLGRRIDFTVEVKVPGQPWARRRRVAMVSTNGQAAKRREAAAR